MQSFEELGDREATLAIDAVRQETARRGKAAVIAVSDGHGELVALLRMDGAKVSSVLVATRKCWTAARERATTGEVGRSFREHGLESMNSDPLYTSWDGGLPVWRAGRVVGAVAVSGISPAEDAELARVGIERIRRAAGG